MRYLITGGSGFIGSTLARRLLSDGHEVRIVDLVDPPDDLRYRVESFSGDISNGVDFHIGGVDRIVHLASHVGVKHYLASGRETMDTILGSADRVIKAGLDRGIPVLALSTSEAYGKGVSLPMKESDDLRFGPPTARRWVYGMAKAISEQMFLDAHVRHGLEVRLIRPFNIVGAGQSAEGGLVFPSFAKAVAKKEDIQVHGDGMQTRSFCNVNDFVGGMIRLMDTAEANGKVVNIGNDRERTILSIAELFQCVAKEQFDITVGIKHISHKDVYGDSFEDTLRRCPDLQLAESLIGWNTELLTPIGNTVRETIQSFLTN